MTHQDVAVVIAADLVERLRNWDHGIPKTMIVSEAADLIESQAQALSEARFKLFPYADATEISGMSWSGFYLIGDKKSINELKRLEHRSAQLETFAKAYDERRAALEGRALAAEARLAEAMRVIERSNGLLGDAIICVRPFDPSKADEMLQAQRAARDFLNAAKEKT